MNFILRILLGIVLLALIELYFSKHVLNSAGNIMSDKKTIFRKLIYVILFWVNVYPIVMLILFIYSNYSGTRIQSPENIFFDYLALYPFWLLFLLMFQSILLFVVIDFLRLFLLPFNKKYGNELKAAQSWGVLFIAGIFIFYIPVRVVYDYYAVDVNLVEYFKQNLPEQLNGFKLVLISDIQADRYTDKQRLTNFVEKVNAAKPDLVLIAGDVITSTPDYIKTSAGFIGRIKSKFGVFACVGDHDNWAYRQDTRRSIREIQEALVAENVLMIDNGKKFINVDGAEIRITFVTNTYVEKIIEGVLDSLADHNLNYNLSIFLTHQPVQKLIKKARHYNYDMFLAGHTHGGQVSFLFPFMLLSPTQFETTYVRGVFYLDDMMIYVTRGLGMSLAPVRYNSTPEITEIIIKPKLLKLK